MFARFALGPEKLERESDDDTGRSQPGDRSRQDATPTLARAADLPRALHPRTRLLARGAASLSQSELVSVLLDGSAARPAAHQASRRVLERLGLVEMSRLSAGRLRAIPELGTVAAVRLAAAFELGRRVARPARERPKLSRPAEVFEHVARIGRARKERLVGLYLDAQNGLVHRETISIGSLNTTRTHPREILYPAVVHLALGFILAHNHPSGCVEPSAEDVEFTQAVKRAGELMGIELYDHLIVAGEGYISLRERGLL